MTETHKENIAIIGSGVAGLSCAYLLDKAHNITLFEKNDYLGGHTNTITIPSGPDEGTPVDTGFIVFNDRNYPTLLKFFERLNIQSESSDMSFSFSKQNPSFEYSSYVPEGLFAQPKNIFNPTFWSMIKDILRFNKNAKKDLLEEKLQDISLGAYIEKGKYSLPFQKFYLIPMGAAIWSTSLKKIFEFPARTFIRFFENHGLLDLKGRPHWMFVKGGSHAYIKTIQNDFLGNIHLNSNIKKIQRSSTHVDIHFENQATQTFDKVVIATHADQALKLLDTPSQDETSLLGAWQYNRNKTVLHTDIQAMPQTRRAWASWNYIMEDSQHTEDRVSLTYHMNRLQNLQTTQHYFVTLNREAPLNADKIIKEIIYTHPMYTLEAIQSQEQLPSLNGKNRTFFCGSYFGYGFHEDAVKSGVVVAKQLGGQL